MNLMRLCMIHKFTLEQGVVSEVHNFIVTILKIVKSQFLLIKYIMYVNQEVFENCLKPKWDSYLVWNILLLAIYC